MIINSIIYKRSLYQLEMGWLLIFFEPVEILYIFPKIWLFQPFLLSFMFGSISIYKRVGAENDLITVLNDCLARYINIESALVSVMNTKLMAIQLKLAVFTMIYKNSWFCQCSSNFTIFQIFEKKNFCFLKYYNFRIFALNDFKRSTGRTLWPNSDIFSTFAFQSWNLCQFWLYNVDFWCSLNLFYSKIFVSSGKLKLLFGLQLYLLLE